MSSGVSCAATGFKRRAWHRRVDRDRGRRVRPVAAGFDPEIAVLTNAELDHHSTYGRAWSRGRRAAFHGAGRIGGGRVGSAGAAGLVPPDDATPYDVTDAELYPGGLSLSLAGVPGPPRGPGLHNAVNAAGALTASALAGADPERAASVAGRFPRRQAPLGAARNHRCGGRRVRRLRPSSDRGRGRDRGRADAGAPPASPSSSSTLFPHAGARARVSAGRWPRPTRSSSCRSIRPVSGRPTFRASTATWSPPPRPTRPRGRPVAWMPGFAPAQALLEERLSDWGPVPTDGRRGHRFAGACARVRSSGVRGFGRLARPGLAGGARRVRARRGG